MRSGGEFPSPMAVDQAMASLGRVLGMVSCTICRNAEEATEWIDKVGDRLGEHQRNVRGNRAGQIPVTWNDLKYLLIGGMKIIIEEVESHDNRLE